MTAARKRPEEDAPDSFGRRMARAMEKAGMNSSDLAIAIGEPKKDELIRKLAAGERKSTAFEVGMRIAKALGVDPWQLVPGVQPRDGAQAESRLPEGPIADAFRASDARMDALFEMIQEVRREVRREQDDTE